MGDVLSGLDIVVFIASLLSVMLVGVVVGRKDESAEDFFLAGRKTRWWGVAGSIFGSNISANHIVGMLGVGFSVGFAQSHFEVTAIAGLLLLSYGFLPVYRKLGLYTLSEYLGKRYDDRARLLYALIMIYIIVFVMMVPGFYIGSRSLNILFSGNWEQVDQTGYIVGIVIMVLVTGSYTIFGGLKAVIVTDVLQSILLLVAALIVAWVTFSQPEIGSWEAMREIDREGRQLMKLYLPSDHPSLPWTGVLSGLLVLHFYYWGANQFIVQRALSTQSEKEARFGIIVAGFLKLLIPFISIGTGIAAYYLFQKTGLQVDQDAAFTTLVSEYVRPLGFGILGLVSAGLIGAILSSLDSMMNSAATMITFDIYKRHIKPEASEKQLIKIGRLWIAILISGAALMTIFFMDPNSKDSFFLGIAKFQSQMIPGLVVAFFLGMFWKRASAIGAVLAIVTGAVSSFLFPVIYESITKDNPALQNLFGEKLNFMHSVFLATILSMLVHIIVSMRIQIDEEKAKWRWTELGGHDSKDLKKVGVVLFKSIVLFAFLAFAMVKEIVSPLFASVVAALWVWIQFIVVAIKSRQGKNNNNNNPLWQDDRIYAGLLAAVAVAILYYFY